jgi:hypothetical protein
MRRAIGYGGGGGTPSPGGLVTGGSVPSGNTVTPIDATAPVALSFGAGGQDGEVKRFVIAKGTSTVTVTQTTSTAALIYAGVVQSPKSFQMQALGAEVDLTWFANVSTNGSTGTWIGG